MQGYSRDSFYRSRDLYDCSGELALAHITKRKPNLKSRVAPEVEDAVMSLAIDLPACGQRRAPDELRKRGIEVSPFGVRSIRIRHDLRRPARTGLRAPGAPCHRTVSTGRNGAFGMPGAATPARPGRCDPFGPSSAPAPHPARGCWPGSSVIR